MSRLRRLRSWGGNLNLPEMELHNPKVGADGARAESPGEGEEVSFTDFLDEILPKTDQSRPISLLDFLQQEPIPPGKAVEAGKGKGFPELDVDSDEEKAVTKGKGVKRRKTKSGKSGRTSAPVLVPRSKSGTEGERLDGGQDERRREKKDKRAKSPEGDSPEQGRAVHASDDVAVGECVYEDPEQFGMEAEKFEAVMGMFSGLEARLKALEADSSSDVDPKERVLTEVGAKWSESDRFSLLEFLYLSEQQTKESSAVRKRNTETLSEFLRRRVLPKLPELRKSFGTEKSRRRTPKDAAGREDLVAFGTFAQGLLKKAPGGELAALRGFIAGVEAPSKQLVSQESADEQTLNSILFGLGGAPGTIGADEGSKTADKGGEISEAAPCDAEDNSWRAVFAMIDIGNLNDWSNIADLVAHLRKHSKSKGHERQPSEQPGHDEPSVVVEARDLDSDEERGPVGYL